LTTAANIRFQDYQFQYQVTTGSWRWTTRMDVSGSSPIYEVRDIISPYGILRDSIAVPGEVIEAMKSSIDTIRANFPPNILIGPPSSLTFEVDEGRGFSDPQAVVLTNDGVFGSLLGAVLSTSASYLTTTPANVGNLAANESGSFEVAVNSMDLLSVNSPYNETVTVQDANASNNPQTLDVTITVRPKATIDLSPTALAFTAVAPIVGPFPPIPSQSFTIENTGPSGSVLNYQIQRLTGLSDNWLSSFAPVTGTLTSGATATINVAVAPIEGLARGTYQETLRVSGYSTNSYVDLLVQLVIS
jgi:hypothetical protein